MRRTMALCLQRRRKKTKTKTTILMKKLAGVMPTHWREAPDLLSRMPAG